MGMREFSLYGGTVRRPAASGRELVDLYGGTCCIEAESQEEAFELYGGVCHMTPAAEEPRVLHPVWPSEKELAVAV